MCATFLFKEDKLSREAKYAANSFNVFLNIALGKNK